MSLNALQAIVTAIVFAVMIIGLSLIIKQSISVESFKIVLLSCGAILSAQFLIEYLREQKLINA